MVLTIKDQSGGGKITNEVDIKFESEIVTVKDIIEARVNQEVEAYNNKLPDYFHGLIQPDNAERTLNGYKIKDRKKIDIEKQVYIALDAFTKNGYFILIDKKQVESLDQQVQISENTSVNFVKLTQLIGG